MTYSRHKNIYQPNSLKSAVVSRIRINKKCFKPLASSTPANIEQHKSQNLKKTKLN